MSAAPGRPTEDALHAYVDGFLPAEEAAQVARWLAAHPEEAARIEAYRQQTAALRALAQLPERRAFRMPAFERRAIWRGWPLRAVAAALFLAVGGAGGWWLRGAVAPPHPQWMGLVRQAQVAHQTYIPEVLHPVEVEAGQQAHLATWLSRRLGTEVAVPSLREEGYELVGGRLLPHVPRPAGLLMYQNSAGRRLTVYLAAAHTRAGEASFRYTRSGDLWICYWMGESVDFALTGAVSREQILAIAKRVYMQVNRVAPPDVGADW